MDLISFLGQEIKKLRIQNNLTQEELGKKCGMSKSAISRIEKGQTNSTLNHIERVINALNKRVCEIKFDKTH